MHCYQLIEDNVFYWHRRAATLGVYGAIPLRSRGALRLRSRIGGIAIVARGRAIVISCAGLAHSVQDCA